LSRRQVQTFVLDMQQLDGFGDGPQDIGHQFGGLQGSCNGRHDGSRERVGTSEERHPVQSRSACVIVRHLPGAHRKLEAARREASERHSATKQSNIGFAKAGHRRRACRSLVRPTRSPASQLFASRIGRPGNYTERAQKTFPLVLLSEKTFPPVRQFAVAGYAYEVLPDTALALLSIMPFSARRQDHIGLSLAGSPLSNPTPALYLLLSVRITLDFSAARRP
jgi:hypothetical protein